MGTLCSLPIEIYGNIDYNGVRNKREAHTKGAQEMRQYDLENSMLTWLDRYEEQEIEEYNIVRQYYLFFDKDTETALRLTEKVLDSIEFQITDAQETQDGLVMVTVTIEENEFGYDADEAEDKVKDMVDSILSESAEVEDFDSDYIAA